MITSNIREYHLTQEDQVEVLALAMKNLGILDKSIFLRNRTKSRRKLTDLITQQEVFKFYMISLSCHQTLNKLLNLESLANLEFNQIFNMYLLS